MGMRSGRGSSGEAVRSACQAVVHNVQAFLRAHGAARPCTIQPNAVHIHAGSHPVRTPLYGPVCALLKFLVHTWVWWLRQGLLCLQVLLVGFAEGIITSDGLAY